MPECDRPSYCKTWCDPHYRRHRNTGRVGGPINERINGTPRERFWPKVDKNGPIPAHRPDLGPCWLWRTTASTQNGYPQFRNGRRMVLAHRFAYEDTIGPVPEDLELDHLCHNQSGCAGGPTCPHRKCVNPAHLDPVTNDENQERRAGMHLGLVCGNNHTYTEANTRWYEGARICRDCERAAEARYRAAGRRTAP